jgi:hypothetical protein
VRRRTRRGRRQPRLLRPGKKVGRRRRRRCSSAASSPAPCRRATSSASRRRSASARRRLTRSSRRPKMRSTRSRPASEPRGQRDHVQSELHRCGVFRPHRQDPRRDGVEGPRASHHLGPVEHGLADRAMTAGPSTCTRRWCWRWRASRSGGAAAWTRNGAMRTVFMPTTTTSSAIPTLRAEPEKHPMEALAILIKERGWSESGSAWRWTTTITRRLAHQRLTEHLPDALLRGCDRPGELAARGQVRQRDRVYAPRRADRRGDAPKRSSKGRSRGCPKNELVAEIYRTGILGADGHWGDYPAIVPMHAVRHGRDRAAPDLGRPAASEGESTFFEIAGCASALSLPAVAHAVSSARRRRNISGCREGRAGGDRGGAGTGRPGNRCEDIANAFNATLNGWDSRRTTAAAIPSG